MGCMVGDYFRGCLFELYDLPQHVPLPTFVTVTLLSSSVTDISNIVFLIQTPWMNRFPMLLLHLARAHPFQTVSPIVHVAVDASH